MIKDKNIVLLGAGVMQCPVIQIAKKEGANLYVIDGDSKAPGRSISPVFDQVDISDKEAVFNYVEKLNTQIGVDGVLTAGTDFSTSVAYCVEKLGLPGISYEAALGAKDKGIMRQKLKDAGIPVPDFQIVNSAKEEIVLDYPLVVKPVDNMGARGVRLVDSAEECTQAIENSLRFSESGKVILEQYIPGPEYSLDSLIFDDQFVPCGLADRDIRFEPYFIEMGHLMPGFCSEERARALWNVLEKSARALGITKGAAKGDIKWTPEGPVVGEVAARLSGGYMSGWTYPYSSGRQSILGALQIAVGFAPDLPDERKPRRPVVERSFISIPGRVKEILGQEKVKATQGVQDIFLRYQVDEQVSFPQNNVEKGGNIVFFEDNLTKEEALKEAIKITSNIVFRMDASESITRDFLLGQDSPLHPNFEMEPKWNHFLDSLPVHSAKMESIPYLPLALAGKDWHGRTPEEALAQLAILTDLPRKNTPLGRDFWIAFIRGSVQGGLWIYDVLHNNN